MQQQITQAEHMKQLCAKLEENTLPPDQDELERNFL